MTGLEELDEADIEDAVRRELEALDDLDLQNFEGFSDVKYETIQTETFEKELSGEEKYGLPPDSVTTFIALLQSRNNKLQEELAEAEDAVRLASEHKNATGVDENGEDDMKILSEMKEKVLHEIEDLEQSDKITEKKDGNFEDISSLEETAVRNLKALELKQEQRRSQLNNLLSEIKEDEMLRHEKEEKMREENKRKANEEHRMKMNENESVKMKLEEDAKCQQQKLQDLQKQFELDMKKLEKIRAEEKLALERMKSEERRKRDARKELASITIQKNFRMYRVKSKYGKTLKIKREERQKRRQEELDALEQKEKRLIEEALQKEKEDEIRRLEEIKTEKIRKEEAERKRIEDEREEKRKKLEMEKKQEEERKMEMKRKRQKEERQRREEQERKMAEETKRREEEQKLEQKKLEEQNRLEEQKKLEQKKLEQKKLEEQKRSEEEQKLEELKRRRIQGEQKNQNEIKERDKRREETSVENNKSSDQNQVLHEQKVNSATTNGDTYCSDVSQGISRSIYNYSDLYFTWESCRENWLKQTPLWSAFSVAEKTNVKSLSKPRRPLSASQKLSSISEEELMNSQKAFTSFHKIVCVNVKDLPPRNLQILSKCPNVKSVTVQNCSVLSAESFDNCHHLLELNLSDNSIQNISCQNLESLQYLDLRNNQLTSIHGLDGCQNLRWLYLDGNKITRMGTLPFNKVIHLSLQNNQLITTKGLSTWKYLQILDCSNNHLSQIQELDSCPLLRVLKLRGNNLRKPPDLCNHVLLRELDLGENSISSLKDLSNQWLPLLQRLYVSNNSLSSVCSLRNFPILETLDVKNNLISDEENLLPGLTGCHQLRKLEIHANPVCEESSVRTGIVKTLPKLKLLDGEKLESALNEDNSELKTIFYPICGAQILAQDDLFRRQSAELQNCQAKSDDDNQMVKRLTLQSRHFQALQALMIKHRLQHETFKKPEMNQRYPEVEPSNLSGLGQSNKHCLEQENLEKTETNDIMSHGDSTCSGPSRVIPPKNESEQTDAARSVGAAKDAYGSILNAPSSVVSMANLTKTAGNDLWKQKHHEAATLIQARFRGYRIRRRYLEATKSAQYSDIDSETDDFNFDEEVDLDMFDIDEAALDTGWVPTNFPQTPRDTIVPDNFPSKQQQVNNEDIGISRLPTEPSEKDGKLPFPRKHAWRSPDSPVTSPNPRKVIPPIEAPSVFSEQTSPPDETHRSHRTSELSSEWGFSKNSTAELMLKRANRMKYNALRKKKMTDPEKRFQLFKKAEESNKARGLQTVHKRKEKPRVDYFSGRHYGDHEITEKQEEESQAKKEMTFSWVYDQAVLHKDQGEEILKDTREYYSESKRNKNRPKRSSPVVSLPRMDPVILAGRNLPLVASPTSNPRTPSIYSGDVEIGSRRKYSWQETKTHSNPDLTRVGLSKETRSGKSNSAEARIIKERNHIL